jgi:hypothetical protein
MHPIIEFAASCTKGGNRKSIEHPFVVRDLPCLVQVHDAIDQHFCMDAKVALFPLGKQLGHDVWHATYANLQRGSVVDQPLHELSNGTVLVRHGFLWQLEHRLARLDNAIDFRYVDAVATVASKTAHLRHAGVHLGNCQAVWVTRCR